MKAKLLALSTILILAFMLIDIPNPVGPAAAPSKAAPASALADGQGCTSFCLNNAGHAVFGTNLDESFSDGYLYVNQRHVSKTGPEANQIGEYARWTSKYGSLTFNLMGYQLAWAGMNEAGLTISTMYLPGTRVQFADKRPTLQSPFWLQYVLDNFSTVEEVIASEAQVRIADGARDHYLVCDAGGDCATIELMDGNMVYHSGETLPVAVLTNSVYTESVKTWQAGTLPDSAYNTLRRFSTAADRVTSFAATSSDAALQYAFDTLVQVKTPGLTAWSIVFDAQNRRASFRTAQDAEIRSVDLNKLDFTCGGPLQTLNIHEKLSGDVSGNFTSYSHALSFAHSKAAFAYFGVNIPDEWTEKLLELLENYPCAEEKEPLTPTATPVKVEEQATPTTPPVIVEGEVTQAIPLVKVEEQAAQATPLANAAEQAAQTAPQSYQFIGWLIAAALVVVALLRIVNVIRRRKGR